MFVSAGRTPGGQWTDGSMEVGTTQSINTEVWSGRIEDGLLQERSQSAEGVEHKDVRMDVCFFRKPSLLPLLRASSSLSLSLSLANPAQLTSSHLTPQPS